LMNAIANGERQGHDLFRDWCNASKDEDLKPVLHMVAIREMEHSWAFEKRLNELGYDLQPSKNASLSKLTKLLKSKADDVEKFAAFGIGTAPAKDKAPAPADGLLQILSDQSIDPQTGALMGRFICEERDTGRELNKAYKALMRRRAKGAKTSKRSVKKKAA
ncbi:MAG: hypothetical protein AAF525_21210, partial [Pseudomonadota bacterium]